MFEYMRRRKLDFGGIVSPLTVPYGMFCQLVKANIMPI